ncbi:RNA 2',3'-cyclic phosphodiesterase [Limisphaera sp. VF-2]|jgi:2'-5' RNA ligase|uniref:RNA 2',3'-cyclic phosphodiesterase n=1 Tax=Limisphaera sp. VF-2 TaxID=3400418 RepID=UPI00177582F6
MANSDTALPAGDFVTAWRLFIALSVPEPLQRDWHRWQQSAQRRLPEGLRWTPVHQLHLTLRFLGDVACEEVSRLTEALQRACASVPPFTLAFQNLGCFPSLERPRVLWAGLGGEVTRLSTLQQRIQAETRPWGQTEDRPFVAHLTLARVREGSPAARQGLAKHLVRLPSLPRASWSVDVVILYRSQLQPGGAIHTELSRCALRA